MRRVLGSAHRPGGRLLRELDDSELFESILEDLAIGVFEVRNGRQNPSPRQSDQLEPGLQPGNCPRIRRTVDPESGSEVVVEHWRSGEVPSSAHGLPHTPRPAPDRSIPASDGVSCPTA